jgi:hypothetical protein
MEPGLAERALDLARAQARHVTQNQHLSLVARKRIERVLKRARALEGVVVRDGVDGSDLLGCTTCPG